jgi:hypothetical protein
MPSSASTLALAAAVARRMLSYPVGDSAQHARSAAATVMGWRQRETEEAATK